nr:hypothetical protein EDD64_13238 [Effusibacillus lacus]
MTWEENVHLFVIEKDHVKEFTVLNSKFTTKDGKVIKIEYPLKLKIEKTTEHRPFVLSN